MTTARIGVVLGALIGLLLAALSWIGNELGATEGTVNVFPDLTTLFAAPVLVFLTLRMIVRRRSPTTRPAAQRAGLALVLAAALVFACAQVALGSVRFADPSATLLGAAFVMGFLAVAVTGGLAAWAAARWLVPSKGVDDDR